MNVVAFMCPKNILNFPQQLRTVFSDIKIHNFSASVNEKIGFEKKSLLFNPIIKNIS